MGNAFVVTKIQLVDFTQATVDWIYGTDTSSLGGCSVTSLASLPVSDRQSHEAVAAYLRQEIGDAFFAEKDAELEQRTKVQAEGA